MLGRERNVHLRAESYTIEAFHQTNWTRRRSKAHAPCLNRLS